MFHRETPSEQIKQWKDDVTMVAAQFNIAPTTIHSLVSAYVYFKEYATIFSTIWKDVLLFVVTLGICVFTVDLFI